MATRLISQVAGESENWAQRLLTGPFSLDHYHIGDSTLLYVKVAILETLWRNNYHAEARQLAQHWAGKGLLVNLLFLLPISWELFVVGLVGEDQARQVEWSPDEIGETAGVVLASLKTQPPDQRKLMLLSLMRQLPPREWIKRLLDNTVGVGWALWRENPDKLSSRLRTTQQTIKAGLSSLDNHLPSHLGRYITERF